MLSRNEKPQFCIITPTKYLNHYASQSSMHLVLAHLVDKDPEYANFYDVRNEYKIMDNGAFEIGESYDPEKLIELGERCGADAIVLPDYPEQPSVKTVNAAKGLASEVKDAGFDTVFVPQSKIGDWNDWVDAYSWASWNDEIDIIGMSILGIPNALPPIPRAYARVVATSILMHNNTFNRKKYHHYLGLNAGPALEIPPLIELGALDSCDSSNPVWCGINGIRYDQTTDSYMPKAKKYLREVDFNEHSTNKEHIHEAIQHNIDLTRSLFNKF